jgi:hypothetical protein
MRIYETNTLDLSVAGPYYGEMSELVKNSLEGTRAVTLVAAGSGINYIIDALHKIMHKNAPSCKVAVLFCTRDMDLYQWAQRVLSRIVINGNAVDMMVRVVVAYTGENLGKDCECGVDAELPSSLLSCVSGRIDFCNEVLADSVVYCQGSQSVKDAVEAASHKNKSTFVGGRGGRG